MNRRQSENQQTCYRCGAQMPRDEVPPCPDCRHELHLEIVRFREYLAAQVAREA
jgi:predicted amidophosphoribosyltransferase